MKKLKRIVLLIIIIIISTGCFKRDSMEDISIITTIYPIEYITNYLYGENSIVTSVFPDEVDITKETLSIKQLKDYSKKDLFIYTGLSNDKDIAIKLLDNNNNIKIIDATYGMEYESSYEELWLNPSHLLMITQNIRTGLKEYITNAYLKQEIDKRYEELKIILSELDAEIKLSVTNSNKEERIIITTSPSLQYLEKYGLTVYVLDEESNNYAKNLEIAENAINNKKNSYYYVLEYDDKNTETKKLLKETHHLEEIVFQKLNNISEESRTNKEDYVSIMNKNIESLKRELYNN